MLQENEIIFKTITGSTAYGTNDENSDLDIRGIAIKQDPSYYFGFLNSFEQEEDKNKDIVIYEIRKAFKLMADCNPNMIELLFTEDRFILKRTDIWNVVLENRSKFLSRNVRYRFTGYAFAQLNRIKVARSWLLNPPKKKPERLDFGLPEQSLISKDDLGAFHWAFSNYLKESVEYLNLSNQSKEELSKINWIGLVQSNQITEESLNHVKKITGASDEWMATMQKEQAYSSAKKHYDSYINWKNNRNKKRAQMEEKAGYDTKHALHLVRLMRMGKEILESGKVEVYRNDREELKQIKLGFWPYEKLEEYAKNMESEIIKLYETSPLPKQPDRNFLDQLCVKTIETFLNRK